MALLMNQKGKVLAMTANEKMSGLNLEAIVVLIAALIAIACALLITKMAASSGGTYEGNQDFIPEAVISMHCDSASMDLVRYKGTSGAFRTYRYQSLETGNEVQVMDSYCMKEIKEVLWDSKTDPGAEHAKASPAPGSFIRFQ